MSIELSNLTRLEQLIRALAHGRFVSGEELGRALGISRSAIWKHLKSLDSLGLELHSVRGRGYRLATPIELIDRERIQSALRLSNNNTPTIYAPFIVDSTNQFLVERGAAAEGEVCITEFQLSGRGRRGRQWVSPLGSNITLSFAWQFPQGASQLGGLSLAVGVIIAEALEGIGITDIELKWPNDLYYQGKKLGGILIEVSGEHSGPCYAVIGIGLNVKMPKPAAQSIDQACTDIACIKPDASRNAIIAAMLQGLFTQIPVFSDKGLAPFIAAWQQRDALRGKAVVLEMPNQHIQGSVEGIDKEGHLLLKTGEGQKTFAFGEVSIRKKQVHSA